MAFRFSMPPAPIADGEFAASRQRSGHARDGSQQIASGSIPLAQTASPAETLSSSPSQVPRRQHIVTPDPVAFRYLEDDPSVRVIERRAILEGYELYLVEQWACSRMSPTLVIAAYTGDPHHSVVVGVLTIPADEMEWSPRLRVYFKAMQQYHARTKETPFGGIMATNLSSFPSALTMIPVPDGDFRQHRQEFIVNEDLKRLGCSGRSALTLSPPTRATQEKFQSLYKTSDRIPISESVLEMIKLCQTALFFFGMLEMQYIDGLLCDVTERAINDWWTAVGSEYYNVEPTDGILGPTTVAALLGLLMGARNRLAWHGAPVSKDVFDLENTKKGIGAFQKTCKLERTRRLDHPTLRKLHTVSAKAAAGEGGWGVQKAVKSTVEGFGGKRGEIVIGMVGGKDKGNIGDIETLDMDKFVSLVYSERPKWLWQGKPRRTVAPTPADHFSGRTTGPEMGSMLIGKDDGLGQDGEDGALTENDGTPQKREDRPGLSSLPPTSAGMGDSPGDRDRDPRRRTVFKSVAGKVSDARSGLGRIRDAVGGGLRGHASRPSRDDIPQSRGAISAGLPMAGAFMTSVASPGLPGLPSLPPSSPLMSSPAPIGRAFTWKNKPEEYLNAFRKEREKEAADATIREAEAEESEGTLSRQATAPDSENPRQSRDSVTATASSSAAASGWASLPNGRTSYTRRETAGTTEASVAESVADDADLQGPFLEAERSIGMEVLGLLRRHSVADGQRCKQQQQQKQPLACEDAWPRRLSFSAAEEAVLGWESIVSVGDDEDEDDVEAATDVSMAEAGSGGSAALAQFTASLALERSLYQRLSELREVAGPTVLDKVQAVEALDAEYEQQMEEMQRVFFQLSDAYERVQQSSQELLAMERAQTAEAIREVETLMAKVEYEIGALVSRVQDVEEGVRQYAKQVEGVETRAEELKKQLETESWLHWFVRTMTGIGTGPNIIQGGPRRT